MDQLIPLKSGQEIKFLHGLETGQFTVLENYTKEQKLLLKAHNTSKMGIEYMSTETVHYDVFLRETKRDSFEYVGYREERDSFWYKLCKLFNFDYYDFNYKDKIHI